MGVHLYLRCSMLILPKRTHNAHQHRRGESVEHIGRTQLNGFAFLATFNAMNVFLDYDFRQSHQQDSFDKKEINAQLRVMIFSVLKSFCCIGCAGVAVLYEQSTMRTCFR